MRYSSWIKRLVAQWLDMTVLLPFLLLFLIAHSTLEGAAELALSVAAIVGYSVTTFYNRCVTMGRTGWSWGKMLVGIRVVSEDTGRPVGLRNIVAREFAHTADVVTVFGMMLPLFPRFDRKGQLFADKIMKTVVVDQQWDRQACLEPAWAGKEPETAPARPAAG